MSQRIKVVEIASVHSWFRHLAALNTFNHGHDSASEDCRRRDLMQGCR